MLRDINMSNALHPNQKHATFPFSQSIKKGLWNISIVPEDRKKVVTRGVGLKVVFIAQEGARKAAGKTSHLAAIC
jgi:hypothetical protein